MTSLTVVLILAGVPLAILVTLGMLTLRPHFTRAQRYRPGQEWHYPPVLFTANPEQLRDSPADRSSGEARGGAHGAW